MNYPLGWLRRLALWKNALFRSASHSSRNTTEGQISAESSGEVLSAIVEKGWWQGSVIPAESLPPSEGEHKGVAFWVIATQTCNLYNASFQNVPVFELVAACRIDAVDSKKGKGDHPRVLHVQARSTAGETIALELDIQRRWWLPRHILASVEAPVFRIRDAVRNVELDWARNQWQDNFIGWLARSYVRAALPDAFNEALRGCRIKDVIETKLTRHKDKLYGIYLSIAADADEEWKGVLGEMPSPYVLGIVLVTNEDVDPIPLRQELVKRIFKDPISDPQDSERNLTRAELAKRLGIRVVEPAIEAKSVSEFNVLDLKSHVRYSFVDYLSDSSVAAG